MNALKNAKNETKYSLALNTPFNPTDSKIAFGEGKVVGVLGDIDIDELFIVIENTKSTDAYKINLGKALRAQLEEVKKAYANQKDNQVAEEKETSETEPETTESTTENTANT